MLLEIGGYIFGTIMYAAENHHAAPVVERRLRKICTEIAKGERTNGSKTPRRSMLNSFNERLSHKATCTLRYAVPNLPK